MRHHSGPHYIRAIPLYKALERELRGMFVGPIPVLEFIKLLLPCGTKRTCADIIIKITAADFKLKTRAPGETAEDKICAALNGSKAFKKLYFHNTSDNPLTMLDSFPDNEKAARKIDISGLERGEDGSMPVPSFGDLALPMELKPPDVEIVVDPKGESPEDRKKEGFEHQTGPAIEARGQLSTYTLHQFQHRECAHAFSVFIFGTQARLLHTDHSGILVTEAFDYTKGSLFTEFLWRLDRALDSDEGRDAGVDTSVTPLSDDDDIVREARSAFEQAQDDLPYPVTPAMPLRKVLVWDEFSQGPDEVAEAREPEARVLIAAPSQQHSFSPLGRYTLSFPAYDPETQSVCWMKDAWRLDEDGFEKEGDTYKKLAELPDIKGLIPEILCSGDVRDSAGRVQVTRTQDYVDAPWAAKSYNVNRYVHYRIVFKTVGRPLTTFKNTKELVQVISDALKAHAIAFNAGSILHRDISINNILIKDGRGLLIDWDMCRHLDTTEPRIPWRTGTWQFISAQLLSDPESKTHALRHDLESFLWLLLYVILRYRYRLPHLTAPVVRDAKLPESLKLNIPPSAGSGSRPKRPRAPRPARQTEVTYMDWSEVQNYVHRLFDDKKDEGETTPKGGERKVHFLINTPEHPSNERIACAIDDAKNKMPPPLAKLFTQLRELFAPLYSLTDVPEDVVADWVDDNLGDSAVLEYYFRTALDAEGWHADDAGQDHFKFEKAYRPKKHTNKRGREAELESESESSDDALDPQRATTGIGRLLRPRNKKLRYESGYRDDSESPTRPTASAPTRLG
ncbi:hypothetical protein PENSPDRAFT_630079 [Peniophora sp. CONT]|nr:hypothetical protein PENSPDRAFT_630079 [Peniophora sp. CONT]